MHLTRSLPLSHTKVPKAKLIVKLVIGALACNSKQIPPRPNGSISNVSFLQGHGFFVLIIKGFVLIMELWCDQLFGVSIQRLSPIEKARPIFVNHLDRRISSPINNANNILICLPIIHHEPFENGCTQHFLLINCI